MDNQVMSRISMGIRILRTQMFNIRMGCSSNMQPEMYKAIKLINQSTWEFQATLKGIMSTFRNPLMQVHKDTEVKWACR